MPALYLSNSPLHVMHPSYMPTVSVSNTSSLVQALWTRLATGSTFLFYALFFAFLADAVELTLMTMMSRSRLLWSLTSRSLVSVFMAIALFSSTFIILFYALWHTSVKQIIH